MVREMNKEGDEKNLQTVYCTEIYNFHLPPENDQQAIACPENNMVFSHIKWEMFL